MKRNISLIALAILGFCIQANAQTVEQKQIVPITDALTIVTQLSPISFNYDKTWADKLRLNTAQKGFNIAETIKHSPDLVINQQLNYTASKNNVKTAIVQKIDYEALLPLLVASIKEQQQEIEALKKSIEVLKQQSK